jgi:heat shock protein HtpX
MLLMWVGTFFGQHGLLMGLMFGCIGNFFMYWFSDKMVLKMNGAQPISETEAPEVYNIVRRLTEKAGMPMPTVYAIPLPVPNAFATGRNPQHAAVAVSPALVQMLSRDQLEGVIAHELAHIQHRDILLTTLAACLAGAITHLAYMAQWAALFGGFGGRRDDDDRRGGGLEMIAMIILAPLAAMLIQMAISRSREFAADEGGARITGRPLSLASALKIIHAAPKVEPGDLSPAAASLYIDNPFAGSMMSKLFSTHPPMEDRIARLEALADHDLTGIHS